MSHIQITNYTLILLIINISIGVSIWDVKFTNYKLHSQFVHQKYFHRCIYVNTKNYKLQTTLRFGWLRIFLYKKSIYFFTSIYKLKCRSLFCWLKDYIYSLYILRLQTTFLYCRSTIILILFLYMNILQTTCSFTYFREQSNT